VSLCALASDSRLNRYSRGSYVTILLGQTVLETLEPVVSQKSFEMRCYNFYRIPQA
jgi:hypothetical protein